MSRRLAAALIGVMLAMVIGQAILLRGYPSRPVTEIRLHDSRLVAFLLEIRRDNPNTYDSVLLNLVRIRDGQSQALDYQLEEAVIAEQLIARLTGQPPPSSGTGAQPAR